LSEPENEPRQISRAFSWFSLFQMVLSLLGFFVLLIASLLFVLVGFNQFSEQLPGLTDPTAILMYAGGVAFTGVMLLPSAGYAFLNLLGRAQQRGGQMKPVRWLPLASLLLFTLLPLVLLAGNWVAGRGKIAWFGLPLLHILAVVIPIFWLLAVGLNGLSVGSNQRAWGVFGVGIALSPVLIMSLELALMAGFLVVGILYVSSQPALADEMTNLAFRLRYAANNQEALLRILQPYLTRPEIMTSIFAYIAIFVPLIEETIKPIGVWFLMKRKLAPVDGFVAGLLSGAGYALFENILLSSSDSQWASLVLARIGTGAVHIFTASLVGWALSSAWSQGRYLRLGLSFALAVLIHSAWNGLTLATMGLGIISEQGSLWVEQGNRLIPLALGLLAFLCAFMIWLFNRSLKHAIIASPPGAALAEAAQLSDPVNHNEEV
jgi:hypothetical protein